MKRALEGRRISNGGTNLPMRTRRFLAVSAFFCFFCLSHSLLAQSTIATGSVQGKVTDPRGGALNAVKITITSKLTGEIRERTTNPSGFYSSGPLLPGSYAIRFEEKGFLNQETSVVLQTGITSGLDVKMFVRTGERALEPKTALQVQTEQSTIQGVIPTTLLSNLPVDGRSFPQLAALEPSVQTQDGGEFAASKNGVAAVSFGGRQGRTGLFQVDAIDVNDEEVGGTTQNVPLSAIQEFHLQQSSLNPSTGLTSSGSVDVVTRSGSNDYHGQAFYLIRDHRIAAALPGGGDSPFQRNQFGGAFGGALIKDKLFFYLAGERVKQDLTSPVLPGGPFSNLKGSFSAPFRDNQGSGRLDYLLDPNNYHLFYRFSYDGFRDTAPFLPNTFQPFTNVSSTPTQTVGLDFTTGNYTHSLRFAYMKFNNHVADAVTGSSIFNPAPQLELAIGPDPTCRTPGVDSFCSGPNYLAPQVTIQSNLQIRDDISRVYHNHILSFGLGYDRIHEGGYANFLGFAPAVNAATGANPDPLSYLAQNVVLSNGQGFASEQSAFGFPGGGQGPDHRLIAYFQDSWKLKRTFVVNYGLRYTRDTARTDSDLPGIPALNEFNPTYGNPVRQPNMNFGPQAGFAWDPTGNGKTVVRGGIGLYYENSLWSNQRFDRPGRLANGQFGTTQQACVGGVAQTFTLPGTSTPVTPTFCGQPIGTVASQIALLQQQYQAAAAAAGAAPNSAFVGNSLTSTINGTRTALFVPDFKSPRSTQINVGVQHELRPGTVVNVDYVRNVETHTLQGVDVNHVGDARFLNVQNAINAVTATLAANAPTCLPAGGITAGAVSQTAISCYLAVVPNANIADFAMHGLDSGNVFCGGAPCPNAAFYGIFPNAGTNQMLFPSGRSVYEALQVKFNQSLNRPGKMLQHMDLLASYSLSRLQSTAEDGDFVNAATDNVFTTSFFGPNALDRKHQFSFGSVMQFPFSLRLGLISHFYSPLPATLLLPTTGRAGGIFVTDVTGDGSGDGSVVYPTGDVLPGTNLGAFARTVSAGGINTAIQAYNANLTANPLTPAGAALVLQQIFNAAQLTQLKGSKQLLAAAPPGQQGYGWLRSVDMSLAWDYKFRERFVVTPNVTFYNIFNFANFDAANNPLSPILNTFGNSTPGALNSTIYSQRATDRVGLGSGVFSLGSPRALEFGVKFSF